MKHKNAHQISMKRIEDEGKKQMTILYGALGIVLWRYWGKRRVTILRLFDDTANVWRTCAADYDHSMIEMCELETGIEIQNGSGVSWRDVPYLNGSLKPDDMTYEQWVYMRQQQIKWVAPQVMACLMVGLHRKYGFGYERCSRVYQQILLVKDEFKGNPKRIQRECLELTGIDITGMTRIKREE